MLKVRWLVGISLLSALLIAVVMYLSQGERARAGKRISLQPSLVDAVAPARQTDNKLRIAVGAIISPVKSLIFYEDIFDYIGEKLGREQNKNRVNYYSLAVHCVCSKR